MSICVALFNWVQPLNQDVYVLDMGDEELTEVIKIPRTIVNPPQKKSPPVLVKAKSIIIETVKEILENIEANETVAEEPETEEPTNMVMPSTPPEPVLTPDIAPVIEEPTEILSFADQMPRFPGCEEMLVTDKEKYECSKDQLLQYIYKNLKYPAMARENQVEGTVVVQFVVDLDGQISDVKLARDIGAGCGRAALETVNKMNTDALVWLPGKQKGRPVRVRYTLPIRYKLQ